MGSSSRRTSSRGRWSSKARGLSESTIRSAYTILRAVLDTAVRDDALAKNPAAAVARPKVTRKEAAHLTTAQVRTLLEKAAKSRYALLFELLVNTGLRRGEALALTWSDVDFEKKLIRVRGTLARVDGGLVVTEPKTEKSKRVLHMSPAAERVLRAVGAPAEEDRLKAGLGVGADGLRLHDGDRGAVRPEERAPGIQGGQPQKAGLPGIGSTRCGTRRRR